ncbi:hypothetical protein [Paenibacillus periandrae]|uniref:hypothetical protein n=1 Tax=Paenibacillus periandrae TaxID=1761741 RepID=UPI001F08C13D|nr:hypothetical protein [Paenibacillus periandrae]
MKIRKKLIITLSVSVSLCFVVGCGSNVKPNQPLAASTQVSLPETSTYNIALNKIKESKLDEADALLWKEIGSVYSVRLGDLPQEKQDLINLYYYVKAQKKLLGNDYINVINYLNQLKPIDDLISINQRDSLLSKYQPLADRQWELTKSQGTLEKDSKLQSKNPADYDVNGNYKPVESMTKEEKRKELEEMMKSSLKK